MQALDVQGQNFDGFLITKYLPLPELQSTLIELVHENTGARVIHIANDDSENLFALSFQTLPDSSNGVAHVLEHTVLCGSKKFPIKDPFFSMTRRSLNTYMNALTGQDFTVYPASSQVEKDFYNLLEVYLDAVFHPQLKHLSFLQEGHRFAFSKSGDLEIQGVVYNEMKGAMSSSDERLSASLFKHLMPDLPYAYNSGGDPKEIPHLTYEDLLEFHRTFYHPSRCLFFFYGNIPLAKHLEFISRHALQHVTKEAIAAPLPLQPRFDAPRHVEECYGIAPDEDTKSKTIVAIGLLTTEISHQAELLSLNLLDSLLTDTDASPLKLALIKSKLCTSVDSMFDTELSEAPWILVCKGCLENSAEKITNVVRATLEDLCVKGFDPAAIEASLHQLEFERTEIGADHVPFGLTLFFRAILPKQHGAEPESALLIHSLFQDLKNRLKDPNYLPRLIRRFFLDNPHAIYLTMKPDPTLTQREKEEEEHHLKKIQSHLSATEIDALHRQEKELAAFQAEVEHQSLDCLPKITLHDIPHHAKDYPLTTSDKGSLTLYHHACFSNRILYADLAFDLPFVSWDDLPLLSFLTRLITEVGSGGRSYEETLQLQQLAVGELSAAIQLHVQHSDPSKCRPTITLKAKALARNGKIMLDLLRDCSNSANLRDAPRIQELLQEHATELQDHLPNNAMSYAMQMATSPLTIPGSIQHQMQGLPYLNFILNLTPSHLIDRLNHLYQSLFNAPKPSLVLSCTNEDRDLLSLDDGFNAKHAFTPWKNEATLQPISATARIISSPVAFTVLAYSTVSFTDPDAPALMVATDLMKNVVLHHEIREKGGAYGSGASYSPALGHFLFYSFRDPQLGHTYQAILEAIDRISEEKFTEQELFDAKLGILQDLDAPLPPKQRAAMAYAWLRADRTYARRDAFRKEILGVSKEEVARAVHKHLALKKDRGTFVTFAGKDLLEKEAKTLPFALKILPINGSP